MKTKQYWQILFIFILAIFLVGIVNPLANSKNKANGDNNSQASIQIIR